MPIIKTQGVQILPSFPDYNATPSVRVAPFNDLDVVKASPTALDVKGIARIVVYNVDTVVPEDEYRTSFEYVVGVETTYRLSDGGRSQPVLHGAKTDDPEDRTIIEIADNERITAAFVGIDQADSKRRIRALRFAKTHSMTGDVSIEGFIATPRTVAPIPMTYSAAFGDIVAFQGIKLRGEYGRVISIGFQTRSLSL